MNCHRYLKNYQIGHHLSHKQPHIPLLKSTHTQKRLCSCEALFFKTQNPSQKTKDLTIMMKKSRRFCCSCVLIPIFLVFCFWVSSVTSNRPLLPPPHNQNVEKQEGYEEEVSTSSRLGSRPPSCRFRCKGCVPCEAIQIPTKTYPVGLLYANYEPEGWRCKCGATFFNP